MIQRHSAMSKTYHIRIEGHLDNRWSDWFDGLSIIPEADGKTLLSGPVTDQSALHGLLKKVRDLGMPLISVNPVEPTHHVDQVSNNPIHQYCSIEGVKMISNAKVNETGEMKAKLSTLWIFAMLNYLYCDVVSLMDAGLLKQYMTGTVGAMHITPGFLLGASILMEIPTAMVLLSRALGYKANRWANILAGLIMTIVQLSTLFVGTSPSSYYMFFSAIEIACTARIVWLAWKWTNSASNSQL
jgi:hypothetical protein